MLLGSQVRYKSVTFSRMYLGSYDVYCTGTALPELDLATIKSLILFLFDDFCSDFR